MFDPACGSGNFLVIAYKEMRGIEASLLAALEREEPPSGLFLDHVLFAIGGHLLQRYGEVRPAGLPPRGGLAPWQQRRAKLMRSNLGSEELSLKRLAEECGLSVAHFARAFRQSVKTSPHRWLLERPIERAMAMLSREQAWLADIALACGFSDQSHFARVFAKHAGMAPRERLESSPLVVIGQAYR